MLASRTPASLLRQAGVNTCSLAPLKRKCSASRFVCRRRRRHRRRRRRRRCRRRHHRCRL